MDPEQQPDRPTPTLTENVVQNPAPPKKHFSKLTAIGIVLLCIIGISYATASLLGVDIRSLFEKTPIADIPSGKIHTTVQPTQTTDPTAGWKTYTDQKNRFTFQYPAYARAKTTNNNGSEIVSIRSIRESTDEPDLEFNLWFSFAITITPNPTHKTIDEIFNEVVQEYKQLEKENPTMHDAGEYVKNSKEQFSYGEITGIRYTTVGEAHSFDSILTIHGDSNYTLNMVNGNGDPDENTGRLLNEILSTFKFTEQ